MISNKTILLQMYVPYYDCCPRISPLSWHDDSFYTRRLLCRTGRSWSRRCHYHYRMWRRAGPGGRSWSHLVGGIKVEDPVMVLLMKNSLFLRWIHSILFYIKPLKRSQEKPKTLNFSLMRTEEMSCSEPLNILNEGFSLNKTKKKKKRFFSGNLNNVMYSFIVNRCTVQYDIPTSRF